ncbi:MAG: hypothetical protein AAGB31_02860 [Bdellovibrio sp.]
MRHFLLALIFLMVSCGEKSSAQDKREKVYWMFFDLPHVVNLRGEGPPGYLLEVHQLLTQQMPEYTHQVIEVPFIRIMQQMKKAQKVCTLMILQTPEREAFMEFGTPLMEGFPIGVIARKDNRKLSKYIPEPHIVDFVKVMEDKKISLGIVANRFHGKTITELLDKRNKSGITLRKGTNTDLEMKSLVHLRRLDLYLGYPFEVRNDPKLAFYFIKGGVELLGPRVSCEKTEFGKKIIARTEEIRKRGKLKPQLAAIYKKYYSKELQEAVIRNR